MTTPIALPAVNGASPFASWKVDHAGIRVPDFDTAIAWYTETLDFRLRKHVSFAGLTFAFLSPASDDSFIFELLAGPVQTVARRTRIFMQATRRRDGITCVLVWTVWTVRSNS